MLQLVIAQKMDLKHLKFKLHPASKNYTILILILYKLQIYTIIVICE